MCTKSSPDACARSTNRSCEAATSAVRGGVDVPRQAAATRMAMIVAGAALRRPIGESTDLSYQKWIVSRGYNLGRRSLHAIQNADLIIACAAVAATPALAQAVPHGHRRQAPDDVARFHAEGGEPDAGGDFGSS
jgi:hypothetical protein